MGSEPFHFIDSVQHDGVAVDGVHSFLSDAWEGGADSVERGDGVLYGDVATGARPYIGGLPEYLTIFRRIFGNIMAY